MKKVSLMLGVLTVLFAAFNTVSAASFLEDEAGISASINVTGVDLNLAETAFKNMEKKTAAYIIGSVAIDGYDEQYDVHVYVDVSGHLVAYYLKSEPASKIIDWINYAGGPMTLAGCKLEDALTTVCDAMSISLPAVTYYDFRYPGAQQIKIVVDEEHVANTEEIFRILIPGGHALFNCSWSHAILDTCNTTYTGYFNRFSLNGQIISDHGNVPNGWNFFEGVIPSIDLTPDVYHEFSIIWNMCSPPQTYAGIVLVYSETP